MRVAHPLAIAVTGANVHDKWGVPLLLAHILLPRPADAQVLCADKGYFYRDVRRWLAEANYWAHIEPLPFTRARKQYLQAHPLPVDDTQAYRWVVERTFSWLMQRRSLRTRWCMKVENWLAFLHLACAHILFSLAF